MKLLYVGVSISVCLLVAGCSGGPKDEDVVMGSKAFAATRLVIVDSVKNLGCEKTKEGEVKDSGEFYRCNIEMTVKGKTSKDTMYFQKYGESWIPRGN